MSGCASRRPRARPPSASPAPSAARPARRRSSSRTETAARLSGTPGLVNAIAAPSGTHAPSPTLEVLDRDHAADADAGDPRAADRAALVAIFGTMGGIAGAVALFVVAGTFTLAITQRRREVAVLRALGAAPHQVRRLIAGEALIVSRRSRARSGCSPGRPLADAIVIDPRRSRDRRPPASRLGSSWIPLVAAFGGGDPRSPSSRSSPRPVAPAARGPPRRCARRRSSAPGPASCHCSSVRSASVAASRWR